MRNARLLFFVPLAVAMLINGCGPSTSGDRDGDFSHDISSGSRPWTNTAFDASDNKFSFVVFSDLTGGERDRVFEIAVAQMNLLRPELIINVGDLIEGSTEDRAEIDRQWDSFDGRAGNAKAPVFYVAGNHDRTGEFLQKVWDERLGRGYYHFVYKDVLFLVLDTEDNTPARMQEIFEMRNHALQVADTEGWSAFEETPYANIPENAGGNISDEQSRYFVDVINANPDVRWTFLFMHKSPWLREDLTAFTAIEEALAGRKYTLFNGHQHVYEYMTRNGNDYIRLATTGGVQFPDRGLSNDHFLFVTVDDQDADIANLQMSGILDKTGHIPLGGDNVCFDAGECSDAAN